MTSQEKAERFAKGAPELNQKEIEQINNLFPAYAFRRSRTREIWTTCCGHHGTLGEADTERAILTAEHQREPRGYAPAPVEKVCCPYCGHPVLVKELGRTGMRENLVRWRRAVVLRWYRGKLWARAYDCQKEYPREECLTEKPRCYLKGVYRFAPGKAEGTSRYYHTFPFTGITTQSGPLTHGKWCIGNPFSANSEFGAWYDIVNLAEVQKTPFRYCEIEKAISFSIKPVQLLTACCFYPRQIEMLMKAGMEKVVRDLVNYGVKNAYVVNWDHPERNTCFDVDRQTLKRFLRTDRNIETLKLYKKLKGKVDVMTCAEWVKGGMDYLRISGDAKKWGIPMEQLLRYLDRNTSRTLRRGYGMLPVLGAWRDYLHAAEALGYPLHRENVLMPTPLGPAHDSATAKYRNRLAEIAERERKQREQQRAEQDRLMQLQFQERLPKLEQKYSYEAGGYLIRVPQSKEEVVEEGRKLQHCVAGYADRYIAGKVTILFMRKKGAPDTPWITIEMAGNTIVQIHGYRNEGMYTRKGPFAPDPRVKYQAFLNPWLDWLEHGSKRAKDGSPKLPRKKKGNAA